ncbi:MAG TPA: hypothetical protein VFN03_01915, partial [Trueperaceae bacterium]|nr:hypothetical protein [Trueperaceae bacterium]
RVAQAQSTPLVFTNLGPQQAGNVRDSEAVASLEAVLRTLGAMPSSSVPTIVQLQPVDSRYAHGSNAPAMARLKGQTDLIVSTLARLGAPESLLVATQWGTPESRIADGLSLGIETPIFPRTAEELVASGFDWLVEPEGFRLQWDEDGAITELAATRHMVRGVETLGAVRMVLCATDQRILGWARTQRRSAPTEAALGRFVEACVRGDLGGLSADYRLPVELLEEYDLAGSWFGVLLLDAFSEPVPVTATPAAAQTVLGVANVSIPLLLAAGETLTAGYESVVSPTEHRSALAERGLAVDAAFSDALPEWVYGFATHPATTLVMFDDTGRAVAHFAASPGNPANLQTLQQWLVLNGLF